MRDLVEQYAERRQRELHENAVAGALATHDPGNISSLREGSRDHPEHDPDSEFEPAPFGP